MMPPKIASDIAISDFETQTEVFINIMKNRPSPSMFHVRCRSDFEGKSPFWDGAD
jgi:hypothetical protein